VEAELFLTGAQLANIVAQGGHLNRIAGMYSGQLVGLNSVYSNVYGYDFSTAETVSTWSRIYIGVVTNTRHIVQEVPDDKLLTGIAKVLEAHAIGTAASLFGDVPYTEINSSEVDDPKFDDQISVFNAMQSLLDNATEDLSAAVSRSLDWDIHFNGNANAWREVANTLKARYYMQMKDYTSAYSAALNGISSDANSMKYVPGEGDGEGNKNLFWTILEGSRAGDIGTANSYLMQLLDVSSGISRNNIKTDETARFHYYTIDEDGGDDNSGIIQEFEPQNLVSYAENQLILAEAGARTQDPATGLDALNTLRTWLNTGLMINETFREDSLILYEPYEIADFEAGGIENTDGISTDRALLREIIEERYVSGFGMYMPFDDARRLRKSDMDIAVSYVLVDGEDPPYPDLRRPRHFC